MSEFKLTDWWLFTDNKKQRGKFCPAAFFFCVFTLLTFPVLAQRQNNIWCFGDSAGIDFNNVSNPTPVSTVMDSRGSCVSIADSNGQLLFYASTRAASGIYTTEVWNNQHQLLDNGDSIAGEAWYNELIIIPFPDNFSKYYLFSEDVALNYGVYYSVIDMAENNGLGKVVQKNVQYKNYKPWDAMAAIKHANGRDWWLISKDYDLGGSNGNNQFHINLITADSITEKTQNIGGREFGSAGNMSFSKDGTKFLFTSYNGLLEVMDFDRCSGQFSNDQVIINHAGTPRYVGSAFSPNGDVLYVSTNEIVSDLYQFDLRASNILGSRITIASITNPIVAGGALRLAPDDKIYFACAWNDSAHFNYPYPDSAYYPSNMNLSVINDPNVLGIGCNFSLYSFYLGGKRTYWGLPNNPDYSMGPVTGSICDSLSTGISDIEEKEKLFSVYPNPANQEVTLYIPGREMADKYIHIIDSYGSMVRLIKWKANSSILTINMEDIKPGVYHVSLIINHERIQTDRLVVIH